MWYTGVKKVNNRDLMQEQLRGTLSMEDFALWNGGRPDTIMTLQTRTSQVLAPLTTQTNERSSAAWSTEHDNLLKRSRASGMNWAPIASTHFPNKSPNACRKRHERLMEKWKAESCDGVKIEDLARAYMECRETMWKMVAEKVGEKWNIVETKCMEKGLKTLQSSSRGRRKGYQSDSPTSNRSDENDLHDSSLGPDTQNIDGGLSENLPPPPSSCHHQENDPSHSSNHAYSYPNPGAYSPTSSPDFATQNSGYQSLSIASILQAPISASYC